MRADMFFGTQDGLIMQADRTGYDDGQPYIATLVGGWEMFQAPSQQVTAPDARDLHVAAERAVPAAASATTDFHVVIPPPPPIGLDPGVADLWDEGLWDARAVGPAPARPAAAPQYAVGVDRHDRLFSCADRAGHVGQQSRPDVELVAIGATYEIAGVNV